MAGMFHDSQINVLGRIATLASGYALCAYFLGFGLLGAGLGLGFGIGMW